jgi:cellulose biosynthesis protein BcsQ
MAKVITFANIKGGAGKSTVAVNVAACLCEKTCVRGRLLDLDINSRSACEWGENAKPSTFHFQPGRDILPVADAQEFEVAVADAVAHVGRLGYIFLDLPLVGGSPFLRRALDFSSLICLVAKPSGLDLEPTVEAVSAAINHAPVVVVPNMVRNTRPSRLGVARLNSLAKEQGFTVTDPIALRTAFEVLPSTGKTVLHLPPMDRARAEISAVAATIFNMVRGGM